MIPPYVLSFEPFVDSVHLILSGPRGRLIVELPLDAGWKLLAQLESACEFAAAWEPTPGLAGLIEDA